MDLAISTEALQFKILAPAAADVPPHFNRRRVDASLHEFLTAAVQSVRALALSECLPKGAGAFPNGRHVQPVDGESWHVLLQNGCGDTLGCARYRPVRGNVDQFGALSSAIGSSPRYGTVLRSALERLVFEADRRNKFYGEAGGWALRPEIRGSTAAVNIALMTFALAEHLGCGMAITTATRMHHSSSILCRIGAQPLAQLPAYYEPQFGSMIEILHFNLPNENPKYAAKLNKLRSAILDAPIVCARETSMPQSLPAPSNLEIPELLVA